MEGWHNSEGRADGLGTSQCAGATITARSAAKVATHKEYVGNGPAAELAARLDARARRERERAAEVLREERSRCEPADRAAREFEAVCDLLMSAGMHAAGFHRHRSGPWRRRRHGRPTAVE